MPQITNGTITFEQDYLDWFTEQYGTTEWAVYFPGMDEITTHDRHYPGDEVDGEPFTEETVRAYLAEFDGRFGPGSPMAREVHKPSYAVALHYGRPAFGSHEHSFGDCVCGTPAAELLADLEAEAKRERESAAVWRRRAYQIGNELILQKSPELAPHLGEFTDEQTADAEAFIENTALRAQLAEALELLGARADGSPHIVETAIGLDPFSPDAPHWTVHHPLQCHRLPYDHGCEFDVAVDRWGLRSQFPLDAGRFEACIEEFDGVPGAELMLERLGDEAGAVTDTRHPGLINLDNAPRLADLNDDSSLYPKQITIFCDNCGVENTDDYLVPADATKDERLKIAREHMASQFGWTCDGSGDHCPACVKLRAGLPYETAIDIPECPDCGDGCGGHAPEEYHLDCDRNVADCTCPNRPAPESRAKIFAEINAERFRQTTENGVQHYDDGTGGPVMQHKAEEAQACADWLAENGGADWRSLLLAQVYSAVAEDEQGGVRAGLVKAAVLCTAWIEDIDSRPAGVP